MKFLTLHFWFNIYAGSLEPTIQKALMIFIGLWFILILAFDYLKRNGYKDLPKSFLTKMYWYSMTNFILGSLYLLFTYEEITVLSARIFIILWLAYIIWRPMSHHKMIDIIKQKKADALKQIERKKYIPS